MADLVYNYGNNIGGILQIRCAPVAGILTAPSTGALSFQNGFGWVGVYGTDFTKSYSEESERTDNGDLWTVSTSLFYLGDSADVRALIAQLKGFDRYIVECQDGLGLWRRVGTLVESLALTYKFGIGPNIGDRRGYTISFAGTLTTCPPILPV